jgi:hypothetical protein
VGYLFYISRVGGHSSVKGQIVGYIFLNFSKVVQTNHEYRYMVQVLVIVVLKVKLSRWFRQITNISILWAVLLSGLV